MVFLLTILLLPSAIKALEFIEKSLAGTNALVPQQFSSDMSNADIGSLSNKAP